MRLKQRENRMSDRKIRSANVGLGVALVVLCFASASVLAADGDIPLQQSLTPGMRVRILAPGVAPNKVIGTVEKVSDDAVTLKIPGRSEPVSILREKIAQLDVSEGPRSRGVDAPASGLRAARRATAADKVTSSALGRSPAYAPSSAAALAH
jgi:hypothetical protein